MRKSPSSSTTNSVTASDARGVCPLAPARARQHQRQRSHGAIHGETAPRLRANRACAPTTNRCNHSLAPRGQRHALAQWVEALKPVLRGDFCVRTSARLAAVLKEALSRCGATTSFMLESRGDKQILHHLPLCPTSRWPRGRIAQPPLVRARGERPTRADDLARHEVHSLEVTRVEGDDHFSHEHRPTPADGSSPELAFIAAPRTRRGVQHDRDLVAPRAR